MTTKASYTFAPILLLLMTSIVLNACKQEPQPQTQQQQTTSAETELSDYQVLEVIGVFSESGSDSISLISLDHKMRFRTEINSAELSNNYLRLDVGERVKIAGDYAESYPVQILNIRNIIRQENPDKDACETNTNNKWQPQGKAQIPTCISNYSDAEKLCQSSDDCQGDCIVTSRDKPAICASSNTLFGCKTTIERFNQGEGILCID